jgi:rhodanese-related sulfurtransferase
MHQRTPTTAEVTKITVNDASGRYDRGEGVIFVDSRNPVAWAESGEKLPGAVRVPANDVERHLGDIPRDKTLVTYCT